MPTTFVNAVARCLTEPAPLKLYVVKNVWQQYSKDDSIPKSFVLYYSSGGENLTKPFADVLGAHLFVLKKPHGETELPPGFAEFCNLLSIERGRALRKESRQGTLLKYTSCLYILCVYGTVWVTLVRTVAGSAVQRRCMCRQIEAEQLHQLWKQWQLELITVVQPFGR
eukprot:5389-Heterococcus_DN1.PRE.2